MLNIVQKLQNKLTEGTHCKLYIEDSDTYEDVEVNIRELLQAIVVDDEYTILDGEYTLYCGGLNTDRDDNKLGFINTLHANAAMLNVFMTENEAIEFVKNYTADEE
jgi:hypothetical protein|tara:strand:+ start:1068 stop:1385 length:318 start_codon:yes stop_codon:yes gene_type:complete